MALTYRLAWSFVTRTYRVYWLLIWGDPRIQQYSFYVEMWQFFFFEQRKKIRFSNCAFEKLYILIVKVFTCYVCVFSKKWAKLHLLPEIKAIALLPLRCCQRFSSGFLREQLCRRSFSQTIWLVDNPRNQTIWLADIPRNQTIWLVDILFFISSHARLRSWIIWTRDFDRLRLQSNICQGNWF